MEISLNDFTNRFVISDTVYSSNKKSYELLERIGAGGNGVVYECIDASGNEYAIKFLLKGSEKMNKRFFQEVQILKQIKNEFIVQYIDEGCTQGACGKKRQNIPFVVMEKAECNLIEHINKECLCTYENLAGKFRGLCSALAELHKYAIHRDIKPENILVKGERWILSDFGLCKLLDSADNLSITKDNEKIGPMFWISPEAITKYYFNTGNVSQTSDVYQLCMVFLFVITKTFPGGQIRETDIVEFPREIIKLFLDSTSYNVKYRPSNGQDLLNKLNCITFGE